MAAIAIDSKEKRLSLLNAGLPWWTTLPEPDGAIQADDRFHLLGLYSGLAAAGGIYGMDCTLPVNRLHYAIPENMAHCTLPVNLLHGEIPEED